MFKWIFLAQAVIYLLLMPMLRQGAELGYDPPVGASILAIIGFCGGLLVHQLRARGTQGSDMAVLPDRVRPQPWLVYALPPIATMYAIVSIAFGLLNRRQGSEFMAELYAQLPIYALGILRGYEILFVPLVMLYTFGGKSSAFQQRLAGIVFLISLPFMGVADSRGRLIVLALSVLCFVRPATFAAFVLRYVRFYIAAAIVVGAFLFYSIQRSTQYYSFRDFLLIEVYQRLDGLNLVTDMQAAGLVDRLGQFDTAMFAPLLAKIPFLDAAREAKMLGRTSTKQYYVQDLLGRTQLDTSNSMIADPLYLMGWAGVLVAFAALGYAIARGDAFVARDRLFRDVGKTALMIAFVSSFLLIENDLMGALVSFVQNAVLIGLMLWVSTTRKPVAMPAVNDAATAP